MKFLSLQQEDGTFYYINISFSLLAVDAGDCGYGLSTIPDPSLIFLGTQENPAAHMVVSKQFVKNRGW